MDAERESSTNARCYYYLNFKCCFVLIPYGITHSKFQIPLFPKMVSTFSE